MAFFFHPLRCARCHDGAVRVKHFQSQQRPGDAAGMRWPGAIWRRISHGLSVSCFFFKNVFGWSITIRQTPTAREHPPHCTPKREGNVCCLLQQQQQHQRGLCVLLLLLPAGAHRPHSAQRIIWCLAEMLTDVAALPCLFSSTQRQGTMPLRPFPNELL